MPALGLIAMLSALIGASALVALLAHSMIGTLARGRGFALHFDVIRGTCATAKGVAFAVAAWTGMMIIVIPMVGAGFVGLEIGSMAPMMTLVLHISGALLGTKFQAFASQRLALA